MPSMRELLILSVLASTLMAVESQVTVGNEKLVLNGKGLRTAIFGIKVYEGALYTKAKSSDVQTVLKSFPRKVELTFLRDVDKEDVQKALAKSFPKNCEVNCETQTNALNKLKEAMVEVKEKDKLEYLLFADKVQLFHNGKKLVEVAQKDFSNNLTLTWIGKEPPTEDLKQGLLGLQ